MLNRKTSNCAFKLPFKLLKYWTALCSQFSTLGDIYCHYYKDHLRPSNVILKLSIWMRGGFYSSEVYYRNLCKQKPNWQAASSIASKIN
ncbi:AFH_G0023400.mRNA.1.CDS.1 [Saccharomyces cerevisiae]|nr:AFH_G0023400.mRNA.1.CDS.1 [Saccharomyces cerevisiae]CAI6726997.1 AFH_G0023400.mRNA.1.CDS.1 [Saccharomyces cerevisiae]